MSCLFLFYFLLISFFLLLGWQCFSNSFLYSSGEISIESFLSFPLFFTNFLGFTLFVILFLFFLCSFVSPLDVATGFFFGANLSKSIFCPVIFGPVSFSASALITSASSSEISSDSFDFCFSNFSSSLFFF